MIARLLAAALLLCAAAPPEGDPAGTPAARSLADLPLDGDGVPTRPLAHDELFRLLVALSAGNEPAAALLARCHAAGAPAGTLGWRRCIMGEP